MLEGVPLAGFGTAGILVVVVMMVLRGALVPRSVLQDVRQDRDARLAAQERETQHLRDLDSVRASTVQELVGQVGELVAATREAEAALRESALRDRLRHEDRGTQ